MTKYLITILMCAGCAHGPKLAPWTVGGTASSRDAEQAVALTEAAKRVMPGSPLDYGGEIRLFPAINDLCYPGFSTNYVITGCPTKGGVLVRWPLGECADLTCSALPHELCHIGQGYRTREDAADACAILVVQEYRRGPP